MINSVLKNEALTTSQEGKIILNNVKSTLLTFPLRVRFKQCCTRITEKLVKVIRNETTKLYTCTYSFFTFIRNMFCSFPLKTRYVFIRPTYRHKQHSSKETEEKTDRGNLGKENEEKEYQ